MILEAAFMELWQDFLSPCAEDIVGVSVGVSLPWSNWAWAPALGGSAQTSDVRASGPYVSLE